MSQARSFDQVVDAVADLTTEEQETLVELVQRRLAERRRRQIIADVAESRSDMAAGRCKPTTPDELLREILP